MKPINVVLAFCSWIFDALCRRNDAGTSLVGVDGGPNRFVLVKDKGPRRFYRILEINPTKERIYFPPLLWPAATSWRAWSSQFSATMGWEAGVALPPANWNITKC